jgi:hypothetical protein
MHPPRHNRCAASKCTQASTARLPSHSRQAPGRQLQAGHRARIDAAQHGQRAVAEAEVRLPNWQQHVDHVGVAVVQRMRNTREPQHAGAYSG